MSSTLELLLMRAGMTGDYLFGTFIYSVLIFASLTLFFYDGSQEDGVPLLIFSAGLADIIEEVCNHFNVQSSSDVTTSRRVCSGCTFFADYLNSRIKLESLRLLTEIGLS